MKTPTTMATLTAVVFAALVVLVADIAQAGSISVTVVDSGDLDPGPTYDLTALGESDWILWYNSPADFSPTERKIGGSGIGTPSLVGTLASDAASSYDPHYSWTDGTPTPSATGAAVGFLRSGANNSIGDTFSLSYDASTEISTAYLFVGVGRAEGTLTASLSDGSATPEIDVFSVGNDFGHITYRIDYAADSFGETLDIQWAKTAHLGGGIDSLIRLQGAALTFAAPFVPEPSTGSIMLLGLTGWLGVRRRRRAV